MATPYFSCSPSTKLCIKKDDCNHFPFHWLWARLKMLSWFTMIVSIIKFLRRLNLFENSLCFFFSFNRRRVKFVRFPFFGLCDVCDPRILSYCTRMSYWMWEKKQLKFFFVDNYFQNLICWLKLISSVMN